MDVQRHRVHRKARRLPPAGPFQPGLVPPQRLGQQSGLLGGQLFPRRLFQQLGQRVRAAGGVGPQRRVKPGGIGVAGPRRGRSPALSGDGGRRIVGTGGASMGIVLDRQCALWSEGCARRRPAIPDFPCNSGGRIKKGKGIAQSLRRPDYPDFAALLGEARALRRGVGTGRRSPERSHPQPQARGVPGGRPFSLVSGL